MAAGVGLSSIERFAALEDPRQAAKVLYPLPEILLLLLCATLAGADDFVEVDAETFARAVRAHWGIEDNLHWTLDVVFRDDLARLRTGHGPQNMAVVRHMALDLLSQAKPTTSLKNRRKRAGWSTDYLDRLIRGTA